MRAQQEQLQNQTNILLAKHWPQLNLLGSMGRSSYVKADLANDFAGSWALGLQLNIPLFSGLSSVSERRAAAARERQLVAQDAILKNKVALDEVRAMKDLEAAIAIIETSSAALGFARQSIKEAEKNYRFATIDYLQFLAVQQSYLYSELSHDQAEFTYIQAIARYFVASGHALNGLI